MMLLSAPLKLNSSYSPAFTYLLRLDCDASAYEVGAVSSHNFPDGAERPIVYVSQTL